MAAAAIPVLGSVLGGALGFLGSGRAANAQAASQIAGEHGVLGATQTGQQAVTDTTGRNAAAINEAATSAIGNVSNYGNYAANTLQTNLDTQTGALNPFISGGQSGVQGLTNYAASNPTFNFAPTQQQLESTPGYQFQLQEGLGATQNAAAAAGSGAGSNANLDLQKTAAGIAGTYYQNAFQNAQQQFQTNQNAKLANLSTLIGAGETATGQQGQALAAIGNPIAGYAYNTGLYSGNTLTNAAQFNAQQGLQGSEFGANLGLQGATTAGNFAVGAGNARAGGILGGYNNLASIGQGTAGGLSGLNPGGFNPMGGISMANINAGINTNLQSGLPPNF